MALRAGGLPGIEVDGKGSAADRLLAGTGAMETPAVTDGQRGDVEAG